MLKNIKKLFFLTIAISIASSFFLTSTAAAETCPGQTASASITVTTEGSIQTAGKLVNYSYNGCHRTTGDRYTILVTKDYRDQSGQLIKQPMTELNTVSRAEQTGSFNGNSSFTPQEAGRYVVRVAYYSQGQTEFEAEAEAVIRVQNAPKPIVQTTPTPTVQPVAQPVGTPEPSPVVQPVPIGEQEKLARLTLTKIAYSHKVKTGKTAVFVLTVKSVGETTAENVKVCDRIPQSTQFVKASVKVQFEKGKACFSAGDLKPGQTKTFKIVLKVDANTKTKKIWNTATATADNAAEVSVKDWVKPVIIRKRFKAPVTG